MGPTYLRRRAAAREQLPARPPATLAPCQGGHRHGAGGGVLGGPRRRRGRLGLWFGRLSLRWGGPRPLFGRGGLPWGLLLLLGSMLLRQGRLLLGLLEVLPEMQLWLPRRGVPWAPWSARPVLPATRPADDLLRFLPPPPCSLPAASPAPVSSGPGQPPWRPASR